MCSVVLINHHHHGDCLHLREKTFLKQVQSLSTLGSFTRYQKATLKKDTSSFLTIKSSTAKRCANHWNIGLIRNGQAIGVGPKQGTVEGGARSNEPAKGLELGQGTCQ